MSSRAFELATSALEGHTSLGEMSRDHEAETPFYLYATVSARLRADFRSFPFGVYRAHFLEKTN